MGSATGSYLKGRACARTVAFGMDSRMSHIGKAAISRACGEDGRAALKTSFTNRGLCGMISA